MMNAKKAYALTKMNITKNARETYADILDIAKNTDDRTKVELCNEIYSQIADIVYAAVELIVTLAESTNDNKIKNHTYAFLKRHNITSVYSNISERANNALRKIESENDCHNLSIYGISADAKDSLCRFIIENDIKFGVIEESTNNAPCKVEE